MLKSNRLDALADGIFTIAITILVFEIKLPTYLGDISNIRLWYELENLLPSFLSYVLFFFSAFHLLESSSLFISVCKNIDTTLTNINGLFFMFVSLVPFSASILGHYSENELAIAIFGLNIIIIGLTLYYMPSLRFLFSSYQNPGNHRARNLR